jgi:hypothetical protein
MAKQQSVASQTTTLLVCITVLVCFVTAVGAAVFIAAPAGANTGSLVVILVGQLATVVPVMVSVVKVNTIANQVDEVAQDTERLANGTGDAKIRAAVAAVLAPHLIDPEIRPQLEADEVTNASNDERVVAQRDRRNGG